MRSVGEETYREFPDETRILIEFIDNCTDLISSDKKLTSQIINSLSGILLFHLLKLTNWITYEILSGKYFEAIRNLRFLFEGSIYAVVIEDAIERVVYESQGALSTIGLKAEIFKLWDVCRQKKVKEKRNVNVDKVKKIVGTYINEHATNLPEIKRKEYLKMYVEILSDKRLYLPVSIMIDEALKLLKLDKNFAKRLKNLWRELSKYQHFSYAFLEAILNNPALLSLEVKDRDMFRKALKLYFETLDLYYTVLAWRFPQLRENVRSIIEWWEQYLGRTFSLTKAFLKANS
ncbi:MAG: hypothetical protein J7J99_02545 [Thermoprotei archaeon]|nr:hypothetical protein [Thermoprotei archaeon]